MVIVILRFNGKIKLDECDTLAEAEETSNDWVLKEKKGYPNAHFQTIFYEAKEVKRSS